MPERTHPAGQAGYGFVGWTVQTCFPNIQASSICTNCAGAACSPCKCARESEFQNTGKLRSWLLRMGNPPHRFLLDFSVSPCGLLVFRYFPLIFIIFSTFCFLSPRQLELFLASLQQELSSQS